MRGDCFVNIQPVRPNNLPNLDENWPKQQQQLRNRETILNNGKTVFDYPSNFHNLSFTSKGRT